MTSLRISRLAREIKWHLQSYRAVSRNTAPQGFTDSLMEKYIDAVHTKPEKSGVILGSVLVYRPRVPVLKSRYNRPNKYTAAKQ